MDRNIPFWGARGKLKERDPDIAVRAPSFRWFAPEDASPLSISA
uniref:Uncharacterized protein n=1 Tax=Rhizobium rhizogenes TaxID=359 RepID=A0A4P8DK31_RHIRH|nr:hypothetical protein pOC-C5.8_559 [Rhizobium rhizogenes]